MPATIPTLIAATSRPAAIAACRASKTRAQRERQRDVSAGDRGGPRAAVGLKHVAIEPDAAFAELSGDRSRRAARVR